MVVDETHWADYSSSSDSTSSDTTSSDSTSSDSTYSSSPATGKLPIDGVRKRKMVVLSKVTSAKKQKNESRFVSLDDLSSCITEEDVKRLFETANISFDDYEYLVPSESQRANRPPQGYLSVYEEQIEAGLRFPLHDLIVRICNLIEISPSQLMPNAYCGIVGFVLCAKYYDIPVTSSPFFSLFSVGPSKVEGLFYLSQIEGMGFLEGKPRSIGQWQNKFFYLRRKDNSWNCKTQWSKTFTKPASDAYVALAAVEKGILKHHFRANELISKELLVHGGIEPGVPSPEYTFWFLMHKAAVKKFELLREDKPTARAPNKVTLVAPSNSISSTSGSASPKPDEDQTLLSIELPESIPPHLGTLPQAERYQKLEKDVQELLSELALAKARIQELEQERADCKETTSRYIKAMEHLFGRNENK